MSATAETSIYDAIGGDDALVAVVDDFYDRVLADPDLAPYFAGTRLPALKGKQVEFFAGALGGPQVYQGQSMRQVHAGRGITQSAFDKVAYHLTSSLVTAGVPGDLVSQIIGAVAPLADDIVAHGVA
ncbi:MAG: group I truncated hemoglobin [Trebonia sp.]